MSLSCVNPPLYFVNNFFIYREEGLNYIGFGQKNERIKSNSFIKKLGWDGKDWVVFNKEMYAIQCKFEKCDWNEIKEGEIGFVSNLNNIRKKENTFVNQIDYLDNYFIKCDDKYLVHIITKKTWKSVSKCEKWGGDYYYYKLVKIED